MHALLEGSVFSSVYRLDTSQLPVRHVDRRFRLIGFGLLLFSLIFGAGSLFSLLAAAFGGGAGNDLLLDAMFVAISIAAMGTGVWMVTFCATTCIGNGSVSHEAESIFGKRYWQEPLTRYKGILRRSEYHPGRKNRPAYTLYIVELYHEQKKKRVPLYSATKDDGLRTIWEDYCRQLGLPGLEEDGGEIRERQVADLDKTLRELVAEGKLELEFDPSATPPKGMSLSREGELLRIEMRGVRLAVATIMPAIIMTAIASFVAYFTAGPVWVVVFASWLLMFAALAACWSYIVTPVILIGRDSVRRFKKTPWGETQGKTIETAAIESVRIDKAPDSNRQALLLETGTNKLVIGTALPDDALAWLKRCLLTVVAHSG